MKVYSLKITETAVALHGRNSTSYTSQYTIIMSPLQSKCRPSNAFHTAAERYHLRRSYVSASLNYVTQTEDWNSVLMLSVGEYFGKNSVDLLDPSDFSVVTTE
jgi:hypothetical protein